MKKSYKIYSFKNDYAEGAHPNILKSLIDINLNQEGDYGLDKYSFEAENIIKKDIIKNPNTDIHFVSGGTQANLIVIASILKPYESVISANTAHINIHEAGAIEATGHKINTIETDNGKLYPEQIKKVLDFHEDEHMVKPKLVFISNTTEIGTVYKKKELEDLSNFCRKNNLYLYLDGARLGSAMSSVENDLTMKELSSLLDIFYIGGTKNGTLLGEAIVINNDNLKENFRFHLKQKGALLAKGRIIGIQFLELFKDNLFFQLGKHANEMATKIADEITSLGYDFLVPPASNQIFPILPDDLIEKLEKKYDFYIWRGIESENKSIIRLVTSWATKEEFVDKLISDLN